MNVHDVADSPSKDDVQKIACEKNAKSIGAKQYDEEAMSVRPMILHIV
jgi:hypothetical protein